MAHAAEPGSGTRVLPSMDACVSYSNEGDKSQSDPSKMSVKFHGCHGHHVGIPVESAPGIELIAPVRVVLLRNRAGLAHHTRSATFRPPIALQLNLRLADRSSVVEGKSVQVRLALWGRWIIKKKTRR